MAFEDFCRYYTDIDICHIMNTSLFSIKKKWKEYIGKGEWTSPSRCGGCGNYSDSFLHNPQVRFNLTVFKFKSFSSTYIWACSTEIFQWCENIEATFYIRHLKESLGQKRLCFMDYQPSKQMKAIIALLTWFEIFRLTNPSLIDCLCQDLKSYHLETI